MIHDHFEIISGQMICKHCGKIVKSGIISMNDHLMECKPKLFEINLHPTKADFDRLVKLLEQNYGK